MHETIESIKKVEQFLENEMGQIGELYQQQTNRTDDVYALNLLQPLLDGPYLPFNLFSLRPYNIAFILNDIIINRRETIIEFGSGISTLLMGRLIKKNNLKARVVSIEHNPEWAEIMREAINNERSGGFITLVDAPLKPCSFAVDSNLWYDTEIVEKAIEQMRFDMVIVDGPPAYEASKKEARFPALPFIYKSLSDKYSIFLDDASREGERAVLHKWIGIYKMQFGLAGGSMAYACYGNSFNPLIF